MLSMEYFTKKDNFQRKYGFAATFEELDAAGRATAKQSKNDEISYESKQYLHGLMHMLNMHVESKIPTVGAQNEANCHLDDLNIMKFIEEYEELVQLRHEGLNSGVERKPYEGIRDKVMGEALNMAKGLNRPLVDVWAERINNGTYDLSELRKRTTNTVGSSEGNVERLKTTYLVSKAMQKIADERTIGWKLQPWNWWRMLNEYLFRKELDSKIEIGNYENNLDLEKLTSGYDYNMLSDEKRNEVENRIDEKQNEKEIGIKTKLSIKEAAETTEPNIAKQEKLNEPVKTNNIERTIN